MKALIGALAALSLAGLVGCNQQEAIDLAVCRADLAHGQSSLTAAKAAEAAAVQNASELRVQLDAAKAQLDAANAKLAGLQQAADETARAEAERKAAADRAAAQRLAQQRQEAAAKKAVVAEAEQRADVKVAQPVSRLPVKEKARAAGF